MTRAEKIEKLQREIESIEAVCKPLNESLEKLKQELSRVNSSFEIGDRAIYHEEWCQRGCCVSDHGGTITGVEQNGCYQFTSDAGIIFKYATSYHLVRPEENK